MSLIIHTVVPNGIVVGADTRTTCRDNNGNIRYDDSAEKIISFPNQIVVSHCGDSDVATDLSVTQFLYNLKRKYGAMSTISDLPLRILNEYIKNGGKNDTIFKISDYDNLSGSVYTVHTKKSLIELSIHPFQYGATYNGITDLAHAIMNSGINYNNLSIEDAIELTKTCITTNIKVFSYHAEQSIGGKCKIYVIDRLHEKSGWFQDNGNIVSDSI